MKQIFSIILVLTLGFGCSESPTRVKSNDYTLRPNHILLDLDMNNYDTYILTMDTTTGFIYYSWLKEGLGSCRIVPAVPN